MDESPRSPRGGREHLLEIDASVVDGRLRLLWTFSRNHHLSATIETRAAAFIAALEQLIDHCLDPSAGGFTPSDFPEARLSQEALDRFITRI